MSPSPRICCLDLDTFFVSVERLLDPSLVGKPVVVGAAPGNRGVVCACSYEVRRFGVRSGMSIGEAVRLAPDAVFLPPRHDTYSPYAKQVKGILERYTPAVQTASIDEFFLDFRGCERLYRARGDSDDDATVERVVRRMRQDIQDEVGLPASAGVAVSRPLAKIASGRAKPAGVVMVRRGEEEDFLWDLPVRKFPGIGPVTERRLKEGGVHTLGQLIELPEGEARMRFHRIGARVRAACHPQKVVKLGRDRPAFREFDPEGLTVGSISNERTFSADVGDEARIDAQLVKLVERVCHRARSRDIRARTIGLKLRYADFQTLTRSKTVRPTNIDATVIAIVRELYARARRRDLPIRLLGVSMQNLVGKDSQLLLPLGKPERPSAASALDAVRAKFGYDAVRLGAIDRSRWIA